MRVITGKGEIFEFEFVNVLHLWVQRHLRQGPRLAGELELSLFEVIGVKVQVPKCVDKCAGLKIADLRHHHREQCVRGDVERHTQKQIRAALVELAAQLVLLNKELE